MLGVHPDARGAALGERLKIAQRERAIAAGVDLIEWTFDPLQAQNAHLNISVLGCVASTYRVDAYGALAGPLHRGTPTDRLVAEWELVAPHVIRRLARRQGSGTSLPTLRTIDLRDVPTAVPVTTEGDWPRSGRPSLDLDAPRIFVPVPRALVRCNATTRIVPWTGVSRRAPPLRPTSRAATGSWTSISWAREAVTSPGCAVRR